MKTYQIIQPEIIHNSMMNNVEVIKQMIGMFLGQGQDDFQQLQAAVQGAQYPNIKSLAHHIKPTMAYIGANDLKDAFQTLEKLALDEVTLTELKQHFHKMEVDFQLAMSELQDYAADLS